MKVGVPWHETGRAGMGWVGWGWVSQGWVRRGMVQAMMGPG
jgi:hypothetical protein